MDKGPFSVEWLAQSSRGGARELPGESRPRPPGPCARRFRSPPGVPRGVPPSDPPICPRRLRELERSFREQRYIGAGEKRRLAAALNLSQSQIKTWFQNRRMKFKRQTQDAR
ncbi:VEX1 protein, partial [Cardinalis cardinalis]|nr:VEX1 protein [Cardinalis cardinalis]